METLKTDRVTDQHMDKGDYYEAISKVNYLHESANIELILSLKDKRTCNVIRTAVSVRGP